MHKLISLIFFVFTAITVAGCAQTPEPQLRGQMGNLLLAEPVPVSPRSQMAIIRYNQILASSELSDEERAELTYQRGMLYDSVGLGGLAQFDYSQALQLKPDMAQAYNSIGIHFIQQDEYIQAYEAFDSTLDINPEYDFAFLNRGIALYYGDRSDLAVKDLKTFYLKEPTDPFRALWLYFAMAKVNEQEARDYLKTIRSDLSAGHWAISLIDLYIGNVSEEQLLSQLIDGVSNQRELTERLCEAYFYLGKYHSEKQNQGVAANYFKLALSTNVHDYVEHRYARKELKRLRDPGTEVQ